MKRSPSLGLFLAAALAFLLAACGGPEKPAGGPVSAASNARPEFAVDVVEARPAAESAEELVPAVVSVENSALVLAQRDGIITELRVQEGSRVAKGDLLAQLNADDLRVQLRQAEIEVNRSMLEEKQLEALVKVNKSELDQEIALSEDGLSSKRQIDRARFKLEANQEEVERARLTTQAARARVDAVRIELDKAAIRAPISGVVIHRFVKLGAGVVKNDKLFEVSQLAPLQVRFQVPQGYAARLRAGASLPLSTADNDRVVAQARLRKLDPVADAASNTVGYWADISGGSGVLPGTAVNVHVPRASSGEMFRVPREAFPTSADVRAGAAATLFVLEGDKCAARTVWVTSIDAEGILLGSGLKSGDRVIVSPPADLKAGDRVTPRKS